MDIIWVIIALLVGLVIGFLATSSLLKSSLQKEYEARFQAMQAEWMDRIRQQAVEDSRAVIRGKVGEQFAPLLPIFKYNPSDARFIGSPIDLVVFDGYSALRDGSLEHPLKVVFVEVKTSKRPRLTKEERLLKEAISRGNISYELIETEFPE
ncbi:MAG: endonuclease [Chloroflexi bacterium]|nr:endonuclease [Chloroflexota bacterium]MCL5075669.1 endonuclease [Chloroflexota bacterium]